MYGAMGGGGGSLIGGIGKGLELLGQRKQAKAANQASAKNTQAAMGQLSPEALRSLIMNLYSMYMAQMNPQMQGAQQSVAANAGRSGLTGAGVTRQLQAGIPGQFAGQAMGQAIGSSLPLASQRASIQAGQQYTPGQSGYNVLGGLLQGFGQKGDDWLSNWIWGS